MFFKISGLFAEFFKILESCIKISFTIGVSGNDDHMVYEILIDQRFDLLTFFYFIISRYLQSDFLQTVTYPHCLGPSLYRLDVL